ncbi:protein GRIP [Nicotiana tabacum]|uniref:Protein GRIP n=3 Tax=Nicotiana TaxID=4085 RepID=A0A1S3YK52_TOBAC|nr:PREDICTED: protein GRIP isoform X1 [Nicotiana sylvestris]XP_016452619.1 PREDICTED: protein GRIP-like isoform X1 [Nicotiana tabacum]
MVKQFKPSFFEAKAETMEGDINSGAADNHSEDASKTEKQINNFNIESNHVKENGIHDGYQQTGDSHDDLVQMLVELNFQNEYLKSQIVGWQNINLYSGESGQQVRAVGHENGASDNSVDLNEKIESLERELLEEKQTRGAAEEALKHVQTLYLEADTKVQELSAKVAEVQHKMDQEIKERDERYSELDSKFNRLHKRAKQRIQEVQKEKDDLEAQFRDVNEKSECAASQLSALQQELERSRQHAQEALKAMDMERQQLRSTNNKLRDNIEELRRSLAPKEIALEASQQALSEKEQKLEEMGVLLQAADEKRQASLDDLSSKHQKQRESLEAQITEALAERSKATETISSLRALIAEKESKIAEMDAASSGEAARLRAAVETLKGDIIHLKSEHEKEKDSWETTCHSLRTKLEIAESNCIRAEIEVAKFRSQLESELSAQSRVLNAKEAELMATKEEINRIQSEFSSYKARAHALLQRKDAELAAARDNEQLKALEEALKEAEKEVMSVSSERDKALEDLKDTLANHEKELSDRDEALRATEQQIRSMEMKLNSAFSAHQKEKEAWEINLHNVEETWRLRCDAFKAESVVTSSDDVQKELEDLKLSCKKLKEELDSFRDLADKMIEEKDNEISRLLDDNENLRHKLQSKSFADHYGNSNAVYDKQDAPNSTTSAAEQQILVLARQQAQREEELSQSQRHILALQEEIEELERENRLHNQQVAKLKEELRNMDRSQKREGVDMTYLKNVILKLLETGEVEALLPVVAMLLQFSPEEMRKCQQAYRSSIEAQASPAKDTSGSGTSLFSRFSFS